MSVPVVLVDYGVGNLLSARRALEACEADVSVTGEPQAVAAAERVVVPGVGAFGGCMTALREHGLIDALATFAASGRPYLGICVGMQMLLEASDEFGEHAGLGVIQGRVAAIPRTGADGQPHKIPHVGWSGLRRPGAAPDWADTILADVEPGEAVYFVHSFAASPGDPKHCIADCDYHGLAIAAVVGEGPVVGCQFHPEKSGPVGLRILKRFLAL